MKLPAKLAAPLVLLGGAVLFGAAAFLGGSGWRTAGPVDVPVQQEAAKGSPPAAGTPAAVNFRPFPRFKDIYELRDQDGAVTYCYATHREAPPGAQLPGE